MRLWSRHSLRAVRIQRCANAFARGARAGERMIRTPYAAKTASNDPTNFVSRSRIRNVNWEVRSPRSITRLRACWVTHSPGGWGVAPSKCTLRGDLHDEQDIYTFEPDRIHVKEVAGQDGLGLVGEELGPGRAVASGCGVDTCGVEDLPDRAGRDLVAQSNQLAVDAPVDPGCVLGCEASHH